MAFSIPLQAVANQSLSVLLDGLRYDIELKETRNVMSATIAIDETIVVSNARIVADVGLITYSYLRGDGGNFIFTTENDNLPYFTSFDITQFLFYLTADEINNGD